MSTCFFAAACFWPWLSPLRDVSEYMCVCVCVRMAQSKPICATLRRGFWGLNIQAFLSSLLTNTALLIGSGLIFIPTQQESNMTKLNLFSRQRKKARKRTNSQEGTSNPRNNSECENLHWCVCLGRSTAWRWNDIYMSDDFTFCFLLPDISRATESCHQPQES